MGMANGKPAVLLIVNRQPNANIIETGIAVEEQANLFHRPS